MNEKKAPEIRFKGFTDDWEERKLGDICEMFNGDRGINYPKDSDMVQAGIPFVNAGDLQEGKVNLATANKITREKFDQLGGAKIKRGDILYCLRGTLGKNAFVDNFDEGTVASSLVDIRPKNVDSQYLFTVLNSDIEYRQRILCDEGAAQPNLSARNLANFDIPIPKIEEQVQIGRYFESLSNLITLHQRKHKKLLSVKKSMLEKMFPQNGAKVPEIRFEGFTDDWEQRKLGELYQRNTERNENLIGYDKTISVATMSYKDDGNGASESSLSTYKVLRVGDIAFEGHTNKQFRFGRFVVNDIGTGIMSPRFSTLRPLNEMPVNFWKQYIHSEAVMRRILVNSTKAGTMMNELVIPEFLNQTIMVPSENEQAVIGQYFTNIDNLITLHQRELDKLVNIKKSMLEKMFV